MATWEKVDPATAAFHQAAARIGGPERLSGAELQEIYETFVRGLTGDGLPARVRHAAFWTLARIGAYELAGKLCDFKTYGEWALGTNDPAFMQQLPRVRSGEDRTELLRQHQRWAAGIEAALADSRISLSPIRRPGKLRLGLISSDLRNHVVSHFARPLFEHRDEDVDLFAYSLDLNAPDDMQRSLAGLSTFHHWPGLDAREAARRIAGDDLDMLVDLSGVTGMHSLKVIAQKPARRQASWLGYPHSTGLSALDYIVLDPQLRTDLVLEQPLVMPRTWIALTPTLFSDSQVMNPVTPEQRNGFLTFGTLNNPYKYTLESIAAWARIVAATPGSKFLFGRPEAEAPSFQRGMIRRFQAQGVSEDRLIFRDAPAAPWTLYNAIDISLDTFPLTGGTTTCEALWMGVPVVSLVGEALFERLSYSLLVNAGLSELAVTTVEDYEAAAIALAASPERRADIRASLRDNLKASPLGRPEEFARDFFALMRKTVEHDAIQTAPDHE